MRLFATVCTGLGRPCRCRLLLTEGNRSPDSVTVVWYAHISECGVLHDRKMLVWTRSRTMLYICTFGKEDGKGQTKKGGHPHPRHPPFAIRFLRIVLLTLH